MLDHTPKDFTAGQRVQMHPATDARMRGDRYGTVVIVGVKYIHVRLDKSGRITVASPANLIPVED